MKNGTAEGVREKEDEEEIAGEGIIGIVDAGNGKMGGGVICVGCRLIILKAGAADTFVGAATGGGVFDFLGG